MEAGQRGTRSPDLRPADLVPSASEHPTQGEIIVKTRKLPKNHGNSHRLFTRAVSKTLAARELELSSGGGLELRDVSQLRKSIKRNRAGASS